jgi:hypothetical protein
VAVRHLYTRSDERCAVAHLDWEDSDFDPIRDEPAFEELVGRD